MSEGNFHISEDTPGTVSEEMIRAAVEVLDSHYLGDGTYDLRDEVLADLYRAMERARLHDLPKPQTGR